MSEKIKILIIDDEQVVQDSIRRILSRFGYEAVGTLNPTEGLSKMEKEKFDAVITDLMMPEMNGLEILSEMRKRQLSVPSIMITGYPTIKTAIQAQRLGAMDYIPKPFTRMELLGPLSRALRRSEDIRKSLKNAYKNHETVPGMAPPKPEDCFYLPGHSWGIYNQEGMVEIGIEESFLSGVPPIETIAIPLENDLIEQGYPSIELKGKDEAHSVFMPLSGRVVSVNKDIVLNPGAITSAIWLIKIIPSSLIKEANLLKKRNRC